MGFPAIPQSSNLPSPACGNKSPDTTHVPSDTASCSDPQQHESAETEPPSMLAATPHSITTTGVENTKPPDNARNNQNARVIEIQDAELSAVTRVGHSPSADGDPLNPHSTGRPWKTTFMRLGPLSGILALMVAMASICASLGILIGSSNSPVADWTVQPSTYLAICTAIANQSVRYATLQGVAIAWWYRASRTRGSTIAQLQLDWRSGTTIRGAITAGRYVS